MFHLRKKRSRPNVSAVILASDFGGGADGNQLPIDEIPVVIHSIVAFSMCTRVSEIILVCGEEYIADYYAYIREYGLDRVASVAVGSGSRQECVFHGVKACREDAGFYAIHEGARPLIEPEHIDACIDDAVRYGAAAVGVAVKDTVKARGTDGFIASTPERSTLVAIQTPQVFEAELYRQAMAGAIRLGHSYADDCRMMEQAGHKVFITQGSYRNIRVVTEEDAALADAILNYREGEIL